MNNDQLEMEREKEVEEKTPLLRTYLRQFGDKYLDAEILQAYPEVKILAPYLRTHMSGAETVLDLGFGTGLWFWASFLPALKRLDGIDLYPESLMEAARVFALDDVPEGYRVAHAMLGEEFTRRDLERLSTHCGGLVFQDYREPWLLPIWNRRYDLVTEHGGGLSAMHSEREFVRVIAKCGHVLKPGGYLMFANFCMTPTPIEERLGRNPPCHFSLSAELYERAVAHAGLHMMDFHALDAPQEMPHVEHFFYGYAVKPDPRVTSLVDRRAIPAK